MVFYNKTPLNDIEGIFIGLLTWTTKDNYQPRMSFDKIWEYRNTLYDEGLNLDRLCFHFKTAFKKHKQFGQYVHRFDKNKQTQWYFIYNIDEKGDIFIEKITGNYMTVS